MYFILETLFAEGKFKRKQIVQKFCASKDLLHAIDQVKKDIDPQIRADGNLYKEFTEKYLNKNMEEILEYIFTYHGFNLIWPNQCVEPTVTYSGGSPWPLAP